ncbi:MAG: T9SS type A sorting domain-containing protein [Muribaculaceae bacterium]
MKNKFLLSTIAASAMIFSANINAAKPGFDKITLPAGCPTSMYQGNFQFVDYNNDGKMDMIVKSRNIADEWKNTSFILENGGSAFAVKGLNTIFPIENAYKQAVQAIDYNNDGNVDIIYYGADGDGLPKQLYKNTGGAFVLETNFNAMFADCIEETLYTGMITVADFNNDGFQDFATFTAGKTRDVIIFQNNVGNGSFTEVTSDAFTGLGGNSSITAGDFDNNGKMDIAINGWGTTGTATKVILNKGNGEFTPVDLPIIGAEKGHISCADFNGDGLLDIFFQGESYDGVTWGKDVVVSFNTGDMESPFTDRVVLAGVKAAKGCNEWADVNGDGIIDILTVGDGSTQVVCALNNNNGTFSMQKFVISKGFRSGSTLSAFDYDSDGHIDVAAIGYSDEGGPEFAVYHNKGNNTANTKPTAPSNLTSVVDNGVITFSWDAGSDKETPANMLRYNVVVKTKDSKIISLVPADLTTGALKIANVNASLINKTYSLRLAKDDVAEWGVQTIDASKDVSAFAFATTAGVDGINADKAQLFSSTNGVITILGDEAAQVIVCDMTGREIANETVQAGAILSTTLNPNIYLVKAITTSNNQISKIIVK